MSCACELARQSGAHVALFDKTMMAGATTGGSAGVICLHDMGTIYAQLTLLGYSRVRQFAREHEIGFQPWGSLNLVYEGRPWPPAPSPYQQRFDDGSPDGRVEVHHATPVLQIRTAGNRITSLVTRRGEWQVGHVVPPVADRAIFGDTQRFHRLVCPSTYSSRVS